MNRNQMFNIHFRGIPIQVQETPKGVKAGIALIAVNSSSTTMKSLTTHLVRDPHHHQQVEFPHPIDPMEPTLLTG